MNVLLIDYRTSRMVAYFIKNTFIGKVKDRIVFEYSFDIINLFFVFSWNKNIVDIRTYKLALATFFKHIYWVKKIFWKENTLWNVQVWVHLYIKKIVWTLRAAHSITPCLHEDFKYGKFTKVNSNLYSL